MLFFLTILACEPEKQAQEQSCAPCSGDYQDSNLEDMVYCSEIDGNLSLTAISTNLEPFSCLETITGELKIEGTALEDISLFPQLHSAGKLIISNNSSLQTISGLNSLTQLQSRIQIDNNALLQEIDGLENLSQIGEEGRLAFVEIQENPALQSLGMNNLQQINGYVSIINNASLMSLGLSSLTHINGEILILEHEAIEEISLPGLEEIQTNLDIKYCPNLTSLDFSSLENVGEHIHIFYNESLCEEAIESFFEQVECPEETSWENAGSCLE